MAENKIATDECIMIGDKAEDIMAAKVNGIKTAGVLYGFGTVAELTQAGCGCLVEKPGNLIKLKYDSL
jgi:phosphoglycolate phosphatase